MLQCAVGVQELRVAGKQQRGRETLPLLWETGSWKRDRRAGRFEGRHKGAL